MYNNFINERLDSMLTNPTNWGCAEAFEAQVILLLEINEHSQLGLVGQKSIREFQNSYNEFMRTKIPDLGARPLCTIVEDVRKIASLLSEFRAQLLTKTEKLNEKNNFDYITRGCVKVLECQISSGTFSGERIFEVDDVNGTSYRSVSPRLYVWSSSGAHQPEIEKGKTIPGYIAAKVRSKQGNFCLVELPDGEAIGVFTKSLLDLPEGDWRFVLDCI